MAFAARNFEGGCSNFSKTLGVPALGEDFQQFLVDGDSTRRGAKCFLQNLLGLQIPAIGQVNVGFGYWIDIVCRVELAWGINHGRTSRRSFVGIHTLPATGAEERIRAQTALQKGAVHVGGGFVLPRSVHSITHK